MNKISDTCTLPIYSNLASASQNANTSPQNQNIHPMSSPVILQQFSMITQELKKFMDKVSGDITKIMQTCTIAQENTSKLIKNAISEGSN